MIKIGYVFMAIVAFCLFCANKGGRASDQGEGSTGAPGEPQACKNCHNGNILVNLKMYLLDGIDTVKVYEPGKAYTIDVVVQHTGGPAPKAFGFQLTGLKAALNKTGETINTLSPNTTNVKTATANNKRFYAEHKGASQTPLFKIDWIAPAEGSGPISFYTAGNGVNGNNNESGDGASKTSMQIDEKIKTSASDHLKQKENKIYPSVFSSEVKISDELVLHFPAYEIYTQNGIPLLNGSTENVLEFNQLKCGIYFIKLFNKSEFYIQKLLKID